MKSLAEFKKETFATRPKVKKAYDDLEAEYTLIEQLISYRLKHGITQAELAKKLGTKQSAISRFESGTENSTLDFLRKIASALGARISITVS